MTNTTDTIIGLCLSVLAGVVNGCWNAPFSPKLNLAVGSATGKKLEADIESTSSMEGRTLLGKLSHHLSKPREFDLDHHYAWALFLIYAAIANIPLCLFWAGGVDRVSYILSEASASSIALVLVFAILFGTGVLCFGIACQIAGVGLGTNLNIGIIMVLGTLLPLIMDRVVNTTSGWIILAGLTIASVGLYCSMKSLQIRDENEGLQTQHNDMVDMEEASQPVPEQQQEQPEENPSYGSPPSTNKEAQAKDATSEPPPSTLKKVLVCVVAAVLSTSLQFAFIFGEDLMDIAQGDEGPGTTPDSGAAAIIWLFVIPIATIPSIMYSFYMSPKHVPLASFWRSPWWRHIIVFITASIPFIGHIHLYGLATGYLPADFSAGVAWPVMLMTTVAMGVILSVFLGEWEGASELAWQKLKLGLAFTFGGMLLVMISVAF